MESTAIPLEATDDESTSVDAMFSRRSFCCCCIWSAPRSSSSSSESWQRMHAGGSGGGAGDDRRWWRRVVGAVMKVREWSELVAGPRWKTFIRRFNRGRHSGNGGGAWRMGSAKFQYDPLSYALNFDEGHGGSPEGNYAGHRDFSARFAAPPASA
ncbi:hypothetical protein OPV22_005142 [Ensete ventricosum]|uniref:Uncharacterized protein n=1 Tax=Ensete ventricosum TaxID=4639 RepID=A0A444FT54_ENSVE|nr:hypothetical protein OPV22_005142 [Ensete ventricosum]RRT81155.1 hypothetical protein B296_00015783 [Ensete ventricosum]RWW25834.1 hypothetical protein GW17_00009807 [Ensete ventricosum]RWW65728.1 hypothetical protein BHE74_00026953 [Ensete ventricosum]RZR78147.1 hypothetical protein BHM03_00003397 [Ensete ventricosum]